MKPKWDPWQQKLITKLKEKKSVDELLKMHSRFLQVTVMSAPNQGLRIVEFDIDGLDVTLVKLLVYDT